MGSSWQAAWGPARCAEYSCKGNQRRMPDQTRIVTPGPDADAVRTAAGEILRPQEE